jgi:phosphatidylglycerophosphate synthase
MPDAQVIDAAERAVTRADLRAHYEGEKEHREKRTELFTWAIYRPVSFLLTPPLLRAGLTPNQVSFIGILVSLAMPVGVLLDPARAHWWVAALAAATLVLDCVDGNMARYLGVSSRLGQYLDSVAGKLYAIARLLALALLAHRDAPEIALSSWLLVASLGLLVHMWGRESRVYFKLYLSDSTESLVAGKLGWKHLVLGSPDLLPFALVVLGALGLGWVAFCGMVAFHVAMFAATQIRIFTKL